MKFRLLGLLLALGGCLKEEPTEEPTPADVCRSCLADKCKAYFDPCAMDVTCTNPDGNNGCIEAPKTLDCLNNQTFLPVGACACQNCPEECSYMCPGLATGGCNGCGMRDCGDLGLACLQELECAPCLEDPYREGCMENATYQTAHTCSCEKCGQECVWECPMAGIDCASCAVSNCMMEFPACMSSETCSECFSNQSGEDCESDPEFQALLGCLCTPCMDLCDKLFCESRA